MIRNTKVLVFALTLLLSFGSMVQGEEPYPSKPITCIVPFAPGGATDIIVRALGSVIPQYLGQPFITINKAGGGGTLGVYEVAKSKPDGYTLLSTGLTITMPELYEQFRKAPYTYHDLVPVVGWGNSIGAIAVRKNAPWNNLKEFMEDARTKEFKFGGPGKTTGNFVIGLALAKKFNVKLVGIPFDGDAKSAPALLGGHIDMAILVVGSAKPHVDAGTMKLLALCHDERIPAFPDLPTMAEQGYDVGYSSFPIGTYASAKTPPDRIKILSEATKKVTEDESFKSMMGKFGEVITYKDTESFRKKRDDTARVMTKLFQDLGYLSK